MKFSIAFGAFLVAAFLMVAVQGDNSGYCPDGPLDGNGCRASECYDPTITGESPDPRKLCGGRPSECYRYCKAASGNTGVEYKCC